MDTKKLDAVDVVNWEYFLEIAERLEPGERAANVAEGVRGFAYDFTSVADEEIRNEMLLEILKNGTCLGSIQACEDFIENTAAIFHCDAKLLRRFAKERGIRRLRRG
jgi:hypothetical protein